MILKVILLIALCAYQADNSLVQYDGNFPEEVVDMINEFRAFAASGEITYLVGNETSSRLNKLKNHTARGNEEIYENGKRRKMNSTEFETYKGYMKKRLEKKKNMIWGPMSNMRKLSWNETLEEMSEGEDCPKVGGAEYIIEPDDEEERNLTYRQVTLVLNMTGTSNISIAFNNYVDANVVELSRVHPYSTDNHTDFILGELYIAERDEIGCSLHEKCGSKAETRLVCVLSPGLPMEFPGFMEGPPGSACPNNYVEENITSLCIINPKLNETQRNSMRDMQLQGKPVPLMVAPNEPDVASTFLRMFLFALVIVMIWE